MERSKDFQVAIVELDLTWIASPKSGSQTVKNSWQPGIVSDSLELSSRSITWAMSKTDLERSIHKLKLQMSKMENTHKKETSLLLQRIDMLKVDKEESIER